MSVEREQTDLGFTLVETMVSLLIITATLLSTLYLTAGYFTSSRASMAKVRGVQLASEQLERMKSVPYLALGFYTSDAAPACGAAGVSQCATEAPVVLGATRPAGASAPLPTSIAQPPAGNVDYTVTTYLTWTAAANVGGGIKHIVVIVRWNAGRASSAVLEAQQSPTGTNVGASQVGAGASPAPTSTPTQAASATSTPTSTASPSATATTTPATPTIQSFSSSPGSVCVTDTSPARLVSAVTVSVVTTNTTSSDDVAMNWSRGSGQPQGEAFNTTDGVVQTRGHTTNVVFTMTVPANTDMGPIKVNPLPYTINVIRQGDGATASYSGNVTTC